MKSLILIVTLVAVIMGFGCTAQAEEPQPFVSGVNLGVGFGYNCLQLHLDFPECMTFVTEFFIEQQIEENEYNSELLSGVGGGLAIAYNCINNQLDEPTCRQQLLDDALKELNNGMKPI